MIRNTRKNLEIHDNLSSLVFTENSTLTIGVFDNGIQKLSIVEMFFVTHLRHNSENLMDSAPFG